MTGLPLPAPVWDACAARDSVIAELREEIGELRAAVARLERSVSRNSGNSSMPPSADDFPGRKPPSRQRRAAQRAARKRGKQLGVPGAAMCWAEPDEVIDHHPAGACVCGADLADSEDLGVASSAQQLETPLMAARRIQPRAGWRITLNNPRSISLSTAELNVYLGWPLCRVGNLDFRIRVWPGPGGDRGTCRSTIVPGQEHFSTSFRQMPAAPAR